jgi:transcriptional regulator with XRE-family HTH domain
MTKFHEKLQEYLNRSDMKQAGLAKRVGLSKNYLSLIVNGHRKPPRVEAVLKMVEALKLEPEETEEFVELAGYSPLVLQQKAGEDQFAGSGVYGSPIALGDEDDKRERPPSLEDEIRQLLAETPLPYGEQVKAQRLIVESARTILRILKDELEQ